MTAGFLFYMDRLTKRRMVRAKENFMLPTPWWKTKQTLEKGYREEIAALEENLSRTRAMAGDFLDLKDWEALSSMHLVIEQDQQEIESIKEKLSLLGHFERLSDEQEETGVEDGGEDGEAGADR